MSEAKESKAKEFVTKGPITDPDKQIYIERSEDTEILQVVRRGDYVTLLGARQTGKTSLLYKLNRELKKEIPVYVSLASFSGVKKDDWYDRVAKTIIGRLPKERRDKIEKVKSYADPEQFRNLLLKEEIANTLPGDTDRLVFLLDEAETVPEGIRDDFFGTIRSIFDERGIEKAFQKYIFVLASATPPAELISRDDISPFNISQTIYMSDFSLEGVKKLGENLGLKIDGSAIEYIYDWTHGHPNLTQEIFVCLVQAKPENVTKEMIDDSVGELVKKGCSNLHHIQRQLQDEAVKQQVLGILNGELEMPSSFSDPKVLNLYLIGVIREGEKGECVIRNKVYERILRPIEWKVGSRSFIMKIISDPRIYVPLIAISRIDRESRTIERIKKEIDKLIDSLESKIPDIKSIVPSEQKQLNLALEELEKLGVICKVGKQYTLAEMGRKVIMEI